MLTLDDIKYATFRKSTIGGYRTDDVDNFIDDIQDSYKDLLSQKDDMEGRISELQEQLKKYQEEEDAFKKAFIKAQKVSEVSIKDAQEKANSIIKNAKLEGERLIKESEAKIKENNAQFDILKSEISLFKKKIIDSYKEHLRLLDSIPSMNTKNIDQNKNETHKQPDRSSKVQKDSEDEYTEEFTIDVKEIQPKHQASEKSVSRSHNFNKKEKPSNLKFGEDYNISEDVNSEDESPLDIFSNF